MLSIPLKDKCLSIILIWVIVNVSHKKKTSGFSCDLKSLWKIKQLHANALETPLGVGYGPNIVSQV